MKKISIILVFAIILIGCSYTPVDYTKKIQNCLGTNVSIFKIGADASFLVADKKTGTKYYLKLADFYTGTKTEPGIINLHIILEDSQEYKWQPTK